MTEAERTDFIRGICTQTDKLVFLFQALVKTSRLETGVIQLDKKPGRLFDTVAQAMSGIVYAAEKKEIAALSSMETDCSLLRKEKMTKPTENAKVKARNKKSNRMISKICG